MQLKCTTGLIPYSVKLPRGVLLGLTAALFVIDWNGTQQAPNM